MIHFNDKALFIRKSQGATDKNKQEKQCESTPAALLSSGSTTASLSQQEPFQACFERVQIVLSSQLGGETEGSVPPGGGSGSRHSEEQGRLPVGLRERAEAHGGKSSSRCVEMVQ